MQVTENHDGVAPTWMASSRGFSCGSEYSTRDAVAALMEKLLKTGVITEDQAARHVVVGLGIQPAKEGRLLNRRWRRRSRTG